MPMLLVIVMLPVKLAPLISAVAIPVIVYANDVASATPVVLTIKLTWLPSLIDV